MYLAVYRQSAEENTHFMKIGVCPFCSSLFPQNRAWVLIMEVFNKFFE